MGEFDEIKNKIELILERELPSIKAENFQDFLASSFGRLDTISAEGLNGLLEPCRSLVASGGKRWRPLLLVLCAKAAARNSAQIENAYRLTPLLEFVHTASLIHDDIEDNASERRGKPCAHISYGLDTALNAASWLYFKAAACINSLDTDDGTKKIFYDLYTEELRRLHLGQAMDIAWHREPSLFPSIDEYKQMVRLKTGTLSSLAAKAGFLAGGSSKENAEKAGRIAAGIGMGFQVLDDVQNLTTGNPGKKRGDDIVEGKKSLPVLLHAGKRPQDKERLSLLFERAENEGIQSPAVEEAISLMQESGAIKEAFEFGEETVRQKALELTSILSDNSSGAAQMILALFEKIQR